MNHEHATSNHSKHEAYNRQSLTLKKKPTIFEKKV